MTPDNNASEQNSSRPPDDSLLYGETDNQVMPGHSYDGIREYDNPMPGWWVWIFVLSVVWSGYYVVGVHFTGWINTYEADLEASTMQLQQVRDDFAASNPGLLVDASALREIAAAPAAIEAGALTYAAMCAACHGDKGQGLIGPNLTDRFYLHGGTITDLYDVITYGVPEKGMPPWESALSVEGRAELVAFIRSIEGTTPAIAKAAEGTEFFGE
jgi:cytochrome c oxidase cbb3-type subunit III